MGDEKLKTLSTGLQIIQKFVYEKESWGIREIARELGLSKSAALRMFQTLCDANFLAVSEDDHKFVVGQELLRIATVLRGQVNLRSITMRIIRKYADALNETIHFFTSSDDHIIFEGAAECDHALRFHLKLGAHYDVQRGSAGKIVLAFASSEKVAALLAKLEKEPDVDLEKLKKTAAQVREQGYSFARGERVTGLVSFAAPILGPDGRFLGGVGVAIPEVRYKEEDHQAFADAIKACADEISSITNPGNNKAES
jgi:IclR family transcriptional regulator, KDG regulon repressor